MIPCLSNPASAEEKKAALDRILSSPDFRASKRLRSFLRYIVEAALTGRTKSLKAYTIAVTVFGRGTDFNPQTDPIVSVEAGRLRRALEHFYLTGGRNDPLRLEIPKGAYAPAFHRAEQHKASLNTTSFGLLQGQAQDPDITAALEPGIAVIVFDNLSDSAEEGFFATGLSDQLVANLARFKDFIVVGPLLRERFGNPIPSIESIGRSYGVPYVLSGTVQPRGGSIRVTAKLMDVDSTANVWVKTFDRSLTVSNLYEIEDEITQTIAATLADQVGIITRHIVKKTAKKSTGDLSVFEAALKMYHWGIVLTEKAFQDAWRSLERAVEKQPDYALTRALLADIYASDYLSEIGLMKNRLATAEKLAQEAVALDPDCADARWVMGFVHFLRRRPMSFKKEFEAALKLNPNSAMIMAIYGLFLPGLGEWEKAVQLIARARLLNPQLSSQYYLVTCLNYCRQVNYDRAYAESLLLATPDLFWEPLLRASMLGHLGRKHDAQPYLQALLKQQPAFAKHGLKIVKRLVYSDENVDLVFEGLRKAGFQWEAAAKREQIIPAEIHQIRPF